MIALRRLWAAAALATFVAGCDAGRQSTEPKAPDVAARARPPQDPNTKIPKPDAALIEYDPGSRTLVLYGLDDPAARWMLDLPDQPKRVPVNAVHQFMDEIDPASVSVFYLTGSGQASPRVTLRDVLSAREVRAGR